MFCVLIRLRPEQTVQVSNFCDEKARADLADYRLAAAMSNCLPPTRKISDGANSIARQTDFSIGLRNSEDNTCTGWLMDIAYSGARTWRLQGSSHPCSRNIQGRSRSSTRLRSGWIGCSVALGRCKRKGERGSMREKGIDGRHRRGGELPVGRPIGNYSIREHKCGSQYRSGETSSKPTSGQRRRSPRENVTSGWLVTRDNSA